MAGIFISHSSQDAQSTETICNHLRAAGFTAMFVDFDPARGIPAGRNWERELYTQLRRCDAVVFLGSPYSTSSRWCFTEIAIARSIDRPVLPVLIAGDERLELLADTQWVDGRGLAPEALHRVVHGLRQMGVDQRSMTDWDPHRPPYPGLSAFVQDDAGVFFGRDREIGEIHDRLRPSVQRRGGHVLAVVGPSGSGKSSLVAAGVLPRLHRPAERWIVLPVMVPGQRPVRRLARCLAAAQERSGHTFDPVAVEQRLATGPSALADLAARLADSVDSGYQVLLVIDQAEELLTSSEVGERDQFLHLLQAAREPDSPLHVILVLRSSELGELLTTTGGADLIDDTVVVAPLPRTALAQVIEAPAARSGMDFEPGLVTRMIDDTPDGDSLPLLAFTLRHLYDGSTVGQPIRLADYEALGGVAGSLRKQADAVVRELSSGHDPAAVLSVLLRLVGVGADGTPARRRVRWDHQASQHKEILRHFIDARLLRTTTIDDVTFVEVTHEAFFRQWQPLQDAIHTSRRRLEIQSDIERTAAAWERSGYDQSYLPQGVRLAASAAELPDRFDDLTERERRFLSTSQTFSQREIAAARRANRRLTWLVGGLTLLLMAVSAASVVAYQQRQIAVEQRMTAAARSLTSEAAALRTEQPALALMLDVAALRIHPTAQAEAGLIETLHETHFGAALTELNGLVRSVAVSPDGRLLAAGSSGSTVVVFSLTRPGKPTLVSTLRGLERGVSRVAFSPDGHTLAASDNATVVLWDLSVPDQPVRGESLRGHTGRVDVLTYSKDGERLATGAADNLVILWDVSKAGAARKIATLDAQHKTVSSLAFNADTTLLATADWDGQAFLWDLDGSSTPDHWPLSARGASVFSVAFSGKQPIIAAGGLDGSVTLWDVTDRRRPQKRGVSTDHTAGVADLEFSPDGKRLVSASWDRTARVWNVSASSQLTLDAMLSAHTEQVFAVAFTPDGRRVITGGDDHTVVVWDVVQRTVPVSSAGIPTISTFDVAISPDDILLSTGTPDLDDLVWNIADPVRPHRLTVAPPDQKERVRGAMTVAFSPRGDLLASGSQGGVVLWRLAAPEVSLLTRIPTSSGVFAVAIDPAGRRLAVGEANGNVTLWDITDPRAPTRLTNEFGPKAAGFSLMFRSDGQALATGAAGGGMHIWDITQPAHPRSIAGQKDAIWFDLNPAWDIAVTANGDEDAVLWRFTDPARPERLGRLGGHTGRVTAVAISPDGHTVVTGSADHTIRMWDITELTQPHLVATLTGVSGDIFGLEFSHSGRLLFSADTGGHTHVWNLDEHVKTVTQPVQTACDLVGRGLNPDEWSRYLPEISYRQTCP